MTLAARLRKHATLVVLALATTAATIWLAIDCGSVTTDEAARRRNNVFAAWRHDDVTRLVVELPGEKYELERKGEPGKGRSWDLVTAEGRYPAEEQIVDRLLGTLEYATFSRRLGEGSLDRAELGVDAPRIRYTIEMGTLTLGLAVGKPTPAGDGAYVEAGDRLGVVPTSLVGALEVKPAELRARDFVPYLSTDLAALWIAGEGGTRKFERAPWSGGRGSGFRFAEGSEGPVGKRVDATRLDQVLVAFGRMQAQVFLDTGEAEKASAPKVTVTLVPRGEAPRSVLAIGGDCPGKKGLVVAVRSAPNPLAVCVPESVLVPLTRPAADFVDDGVLGSTVDEISELRVERGGAVIDVVRTGTAFKMREPETRDVAAESGNAVLEGLVSATGKLAPDDTELAEGVRIKVRVVSVGGVTPEGGAAERIEEIEIGKTKDGSHVALRKEDGAKLLLGEASAAAFAVSELSLRDLTVLSFRGDDIELFEVEGRGRKQRVQRTGGDLELLEPKGEGLACDVTFATDAMNGFAKLKAERWVAAAPDASFGLDPPRLRAVARLAEGAGSGTAGKELAIRIGARTDDGWYAQVEGKSEVFVAPRRFALALDRLFISRIAFHVSPEVVSSIELVAGTARLELVRDGKQLKVASGGGAAKAADVQEALSKLIPLAAVSTGAPSAEQGLAEPALRVRFTFRKDPDDPPDAPTSAELYVGAAETWDDAPVYYARRKGIAATYVVPQQPIKTLLEAVRAR